MTGKSKDSVTSSTRFAAFNIIILLSRAFTMLANQDIISSKYAAIELSLIKISSRVMTDIAVDIQFPITSH